MHEKYNGIGTYRPTDEDRLSGNIPNMGPAGSLEPPFTETRELIKDAHAFLNSLTGAPKCHKNPKDLHERLTNLHFEVQGHWVDLVVKEKEVEDEAKGRRLREKVARYRHETHGLVVELKRILDDLPMV